jgi:hypothetical protein
MSIFDCFFQNISKTVISSIFILSGIAAVISGFTILPVLGFLAAVPLFYLGWYFIRVPLNRQCEIEP